MNEFIESIIKRDPAAKNKLVVVVAYPGVKSIFFHCIANKIWNINLFNDEKIVLIIWIACSFYFATISASRSLKGLINYE